MAAHRLGLDPAQGYCWYSRKDHILSEHTIQINPTLNYEPQFFSIYISASWTTTSNIYEYATYIGPQLLCGIYCLVVVAAVSMKLKLDSMRLDRQIDHRSTGERSDVDIRRRKTQKAINRVVRRILLYPLVPIITQSEFKKKRIALAGLVSKSVERCHALSRCFNMALSSSLLLIIVAFFYSSWLHRQ